jgi:hypothetical protein
VDDPWDKPKQYVHYRNEVHGQTSKTYLAGRLIRQTAVSQSMPSWLALRSWRRGARHRDVSVIADDHSDHATGVPMIGEPELFDWNPYPATSIGTAEAETSRCSMLQAGDARRTLCYVAADGTRIGPQLKGLYFFSSSRARVQSAQ